MSKYVRSFNNGKPANQINTAPHLYNTGAPHIREEVTDEIKKEFAEVISYSKVLGHKSNDYFYNVYNIYLENTSYFRDNIKTSYLQSINKTLADNIIDNNTYFQKFNGDPVEEPEFYGYKVTLDKFTLEELILCGNLYGKAMLLPHLEDDEVTISVVHPWQYKLYDDEVHIMYYKLKKDVKNETEEEVPIIFKRKFEELDNGEYLVKDRYYEYEKDKPYATKTFKVMILPFKEIKSERMFTDGVLELSFVHSAAWTSLYKDIKTGASLAIVDERMTDKNGNINDKRLNYVAVNGATSTINALDGQRDKMFFEHYSPSIRSTDPDNIIKMVENKTASIMNLPVSIISSATATGEMVVDSKTAKRFNKTKKLLQEDINLMLKPLQIELILEDYKNETKDSIIKSGVLLKQNTLGTQLPILLELYSDKPEEWVMKEYLKAEIKSNTPLTDDEKELAIELGLVTEIEELATEQVNQDNEQEGEQPTEENKKGDITGAKQMENADKVNIQGVAATDT